MNNLFVAIISLISYLYLLLLCNKYIVIHIPGNKWPSNNKNSISLIAGNE